MFRLKEVVGWRCYLLTVCGNAVALAHTTALTSSPSPVGFDLRSKSQVIFINGGPEPLSLLFPAIPHFLYTVLF